MKKIKEAWKFDSEVATVPTHSVYFTYFNGCLYFWWIESVRRLRANRRDIMCTHLQQ